MSEAKTMGRPKKNPTLDEQIEKAKAKVFKLSGPYHEAVEDLKVLIDKKNKTQEDRLLEAFATSKRSLEEVIAFMETDPAGDADAEE